MNVLQGRRCGLSAMAAVLLASIILLAAFAEAETEPSVVLLDIDGPVGPAISDYVERGLEEAQERRATTVVLRINTPGGLDTSMREVIKAVLASPVPVIGYVAPSGARAASAGTYILYATHLAAMAPATNLGAATPVRIGGLPLPDGGQDNERDAQDSAPSRLSHPTLDDKAVSDAVAYIRSLAQLHGRNAEWAEKAVVEAASLSAEEALKARVIELVADDVEGLLVKANGRTVKVLGAEHTLITEGARVFVLVPDWRTEFLGVITNPTIAYILLLVGIYGLVFEFWNPGFAGSGVIGAVCLVLALFALHQLPVNYAGLGLIGLGIAFMVAEAFVPAFGVLGIGGVVAFVVGSVMLLETDAPGFEISWALIASVGVVSSGLFLLGMVLLARARRRPVVSGREEMIGLEGEVIEWAEAEGRVRAHGELWNARAGQPLAPGAKVRVVDVDRLTLVVEPTVEHKEA